MLLNECHLGNKRATPTFFYFVRIPSHFSVLLVANMSVNMEMTNTLLWGIAHGLATISHLLMGIVGIITFHNTAIQALEDFMSGASLGSSSIRQMGDASLLQGATAVVSQVFPQLFLAPAFSRMSSNGS